MAVVGLRVKDGAQVVPGFGVVGAQLDGLFKIGASLGIHEHVLAGNADFVEDDRRNRLHGLVGADRGQVVATEVEHVALGFFAGEAGCGGCGRGGVFGERGRKADRGGERFVRLRLHQLLGCRRGLHGDGRWRGLLGRNRRGNRQERKQDEKERRRRESRDELRKTGRGLGTRHLHRGAPPAAGRAWHRAK